MQDTDRIAMIYGLLVKNCMEDLRYSSTICRRLDTDLTAEWIVKNIELLDEIIKNDR
jgi:hypothetical protein